jgi:hypothetical protein
MGRLKRGGRRHRFGSLRREGADDRWRGWMPVTVWVTGMSARVSLSDEEDGFANGREGDEEGDKEDGLEVL